MALLIDGLDEFDEDRHEDHRDLVHLLREANNTTGVKICVSSRPWNIFRDAYSKNPMLQLENLTREDIKSFVQEQLQLSPGYSDFAATNPKAAFKLITDIVHKSQGVFLWVSVISDLLETALQEGTSISDLQAIIDDLPSEVADLFRYIWNRTSKRFRAEASQYFRLMKICQERQTNLPALTLWFGDKQISADFDVANVTSEYLTGAIKTLERSLMSRTGGLLELVSRNAGYTQNPEDVRVDYMHRTANDWVSENWESIASATDPGFDPFFWFVKGQALSIVLTTKPNPGNLTDLADWPSVWHIASSVPEDHLDREVLVATLDRLDHHLVSHMPKYIYQGPLGFYWVNRVGEPPSNSIMKQQMGVGTLICANFLEFAARVPIPAYLKYKVEENPRLFSAADHYWIGILYNILFGEIWFGNPETRLNLLDFLIQGKDRPPLDLLRIATDKAKHATLVVSTVHSTDHPMFTYFTRANDMLESRISNPAFRFASWVKQVRYWGQRRRRR